MTTPTSYVRYRVPSNHGEELFLPARRELPALLEHNLSVRTCQLRGLCGASWEELTSHTKGEILAAAGDFTRRYADVPKLPSPAGPLILTGHQPELFHPGVWLKNFAAVELAQQAGGTALNLIIDNDVCRSPAIAVPTGSVESPQVERIPFDVQHREVPYEERKIQDGSLWRSFGQRVTETLAPLVPEPLIAAWWPQVLAATAGELPLGWVLARARHQLELEWGNRSLELPQSLVCQTVGFRRFALDLWVRGDEFREVHNAVLAEYRQRHRLRNRAQPVPDLSRESPWSESPFWVWTAADPRRRALFVRQSGPTCQLTDRGSWNGELPLTPEGDPSAALALLAEWEHAGVRLRTRALTTTLFARLLIGDLFIHGIGGAKYDQLTDAICASFFGVSLPRLAVVTGTYRLPIPSIAESPESSATIRQRLRDLEFHPEGHLQHLADSPRQSEALVDLVARKRSWLATIKTPDNAAERHRAIQAVNSALRHQLSNHQADLEAALLRVQHRERVQQILQSREYSFCLHPAARLQQELASGKK